MKDYKTYLFDADGTLVDTADLVCHCFQYVAQKHCSLSLSRKDILSGYGLPLKGQLITHLGDDLDIDTVLDDFIEYQLQILEENIQLFSGVKTSLETLHNQGKKLALVTSRKRYSTGRILEYTELAQYFDTIINPEDTTLHKPDAAPALLALSRLDADKSTAVFVGDSQYDILSGDAAGIDTVFVNWSHADPETLPVQPTWRIDSMLELIVG